jgi:hypothetical protein
MTYIATQQINDMNGNATFLVAPIDGSHYGERMPATAIDWTDTLLDTETDTEVDA